MSKLQLSVAIGDYDRMRPLVDATVQIDGVDPQFMLLEPEEIFFRAFRQADFDICELSMSSYAVEIAGGRGWAGEVHDDAPVDVIGVDAVIGGFKRRRVGQGRRQE